MGRATGRRRFKPRLYGLVHTEAAAGLVLALAPDSAGVGHFRDVLFRLLADFGVLVIPSRAIIPS